MKFRYAYSLLVQSLLLFSFAHADKPYSSTGYAGWDMRISFSGNGYMDFGSEWNYRRPLKNDRWWVSQKLFGISWVKQDKDVILSSQGAIELITWFIARAVDRRSNLEACSSGLFTALSLPSSQYDFALTDYIFIGISNNTEYIFFRGHSGNRGIFYTPALTFSVCGYPNAEISDSWDLQIQIGRTFCWNFEGKSFAKGWTVGGLICFGYSL